MIQNKMDLNFFFLTRLRGRSFVSSLISFQDGRNLFFKRRLGAYSHANKVYFKIKVGTYS